MLIKYIVFFFLLVFNFWISFWWNLEWVNIITREARWADESLRYYSNEAYSDLLKRRDEYRKYLEELYDNDYDKYLEASKSIRINDARNSYLLNNFSDSIVIDNTVTHLDWERLLWPNSYKFNKNSLVVHHTANDLNNFKSQEEVITFLRNIYRSHAVVNWWWDIWYNFIIDPFGNIYEWRSWWEWVVWAHAAWNNVNSVWVALIWNFEYQEPTPAQISSLLDILTSLSIKYSINPFEERYYHKPISYEPYILDLVNYSIVWHRDMWATACPWKNLYSQLPLIREIVYKRINNPNLILSNNNIINSNKRKIDLTTKSTLVSNSLNRSFSNISTNDNILLSCKSIKSTVSVDNCRIINWQIHFDLNYVSPVATWKHTLIFETETTIINYTFSILWYNDIILAIDRLKKNYINTYWKVNISMFLPKIEKKVTYEEALEYLKWNVKVLLYELTFDLDFYDMYCDKQCDIYIDNNSFFWVSNFSFRKENDKLLLNIDWTVYNSNYIDIINKKDNGLIVFNNYNRKSFAWIPWNSFRWNIHIKKDYVKPLNKPIEYNWAIINNLDFYSYMKWIVETNDQEHIEKNKIMALISKNYMLFYFDKVNIHPSIPWNSSYNAVDDPRIFQKYSWAWVEKTINKRYKALEDTWYEIVLFDWYIPILPYFNCSPWFTWSAYERFGWIDTPYLNNKLDFVSCDNFLWHWVWLSWRWADYLANNWIKYNSILNYYYENVIIR